MTRGPLKIKGYAGGTRCCTFFDNLEASTSNSWDRGVQLFGTSKGIKENKGAIRTRRNTADVEKIPLKGEGGK